MNLKRYRIVFWVLGLLSAVALFQDVLANGRPLFCRIDGKAYFPGLRTIFFDKARRYSEPALQRINDLPQPFEAWKNEDNYDEPPIFAPIPFSPGEFSHANMEPLSAPGHVHTGLSSRFVHWLGTDGEGRDVAAALVSGTRIALMVGIFSMVVSGMIGLLIGALAGFWGDNQLRTSLTTLIFVIFGIFVAFFYGITARRYALETAESVTEWIKSGGIFTGVMLGFVGFGKLLGKFVPSRKITIPVDLILMRFTEVFNAIPKLIFIIIIAALLPAHQNLWVMIVLIGLLSWTDLALFIRAELLRVRELDYVTAARGLGISNLRIFLRHALPNALRPALVIVTFNVAGAILLETSLTFIGFGAGKLNGISWGSLLNSVKDNPSAWWIALPSGLAIALTIMTINKMGELLSDTKR